MDDDWLIADLFAEFKETSWDIAVRDRDTDVCIEVAHPMKDPEPTQFCGKLADVLGKARQHIIEHS